MNVKRKGNLLLNADIILPETVYATFNEGLVDSVKDDIADRIRFGGEMLDIYAQFRSNLHITNVVAMLNKMETVYTDYNYSVLTKGRSL